MDTKGAHETSYTGNYWQKEELTAYTSSHNVDEVIFKIIPEAVTLNNALATGEIDISAMLDAMYVGDYLGKDGYNAQSFQDNITKYLIFNNNVFPDAAARQAIATAIDVQDLITFAYNGTGAKAASTLGNSNYPDYLTSWEEEEYYDYDEEKAAAMVETAGLTGQKYTLMYCTGDINKNLAEAIQSCLSFVGIDVELKPYDTNLFNNYKFAEDVNEWDLMLDEGGSSGLLVNVWKLTLDRNTNTHGKTTGYVVDDALQALMEAAMEDNSPENMDAVHQYVKEQCYEYGLVVPVTYLIHTTNIQVPAKCFRGQILPGACTY